MDAYDYDNQKWVSGIDGAWIAVEQIREEIALYSGPDARKHLDFIGSPLSVSATLAGLNANLEIAESEIRASAEVRS